MEFRVFCGHLHPEPEMFIWGNYRWENDFIQTRKNCPRSLDGNPKPFLICGIGRIYRHADHIHGILIIDKRDDGRECPGRDDLDHKSAKTPKLDQKSAKTPKLNPKSVQTPNLGVSTGGKNPKWKPVTLGVIINQYKRICTINARKTDPNFAWQTRFHDIIIRDDRAFQNISKYIVNNPSKWAADKFYGK